MKRRARVPSPTPPSGPIATYTRLLRAIEADLNEKIRAAFEQETGVRFDGPADGGGPMLDGDGVKRLARRLAQLAKDAVRRKDLVKTLVEVARRTDKNAAENLARQVRAVRGIDVVPPDPRQTRLLDLFREEQVNMIRSMTYEMTLRVRSVLDEHRGARVQDVAKRIREQTGATKSKAALIARDQVLKLNASVTWARHTAAGIDEYEWSTSADARVRAAHGALEGKRFKYAEPPVVDDTGRRANPGEDYQCRCVAVPVVPETWPPVSPPVSP